MTRLLYMFLFAINFAWTENVHLSINTSKATLQGQAWEYGKSHICVNMGLLEPVCLFWHKIPSDWQLRLDIPPAATTHAWLVMKNISPSSWLHTRHTKKICSHAEQRPMTHVLYKTDKSNFESYGNLTAILLQQGAGSMRTNSVVNEGVIIFVSLVAFFNLHVELSKPSSRIFSQRDEMWALEDESMKRNHL